MTNEQLMQPRYLVIADYPDCFANVGVVLNLKYNSGQSQYEYDHTEHGGTYTSSESWFDEYPHLFRRLEWWEFRDEKDMPEYVKTVGGEIVFKFHGFGRLQNEYAVVNKDPYRSFPLNILIPATKNEYQNYHHE